MRPRGRLAAALVLYRLWRRLPPAQRRLVFGTARRHGFRLATLAWTLSRQRRAAQRARG